MSFANCLRIVLLVGSLVAVPARAALDPTEADWDRQFRRAAIAFRGTVLRSECFAESDGSLATRHAVLVEETLKGRLPDLIEVTLPGGDQVGFGERQGCVPRMRPSESNLFLLTRDGKGRWIPLLSCASVRRLGAQPDNGRALLARSRWLALTEAGPGADATLDPVAFLPGLSVGVQEQAVHSSATNLSTDGNNIPSRFTKPDRGESIPYLVDTTSLPAGVSVSQALTAVSNACAAWAGAAFLKFQFEGLTNFNASARDIQINDGRLRIQLHDAHNVIPGTSMLGIGGRAYDNSVVGSQEWTTGGQVSGNDFHNTLRAYVVIEHTATPVQNLATLEAVLCHEIGHALGLAHSSEDPDEPANSPARLAIMYYTIQPGTPGAALGTMDHSVVQQSYPTNNSPPFTFNRMMDIVTANPQPSGNGINEVELRGYDLQQTNLVLARAMNAANNGTYQLTGSRLRYTASGLFQQDREDPASGFAFDREYFRFGDGTHFSPYGEARVLGFQRDNYPPGASDGIPDSVMTNYFGSPNPAAGPNRGADQDWDEDTLTNLEEYRVGMNLTNAASAQRVALLPGVVLEWQAKPYELYEVQCSTNGLHWLWEKSVVPTVDPGRVNLSPSRYPSCLVRVLNVP